MSADTGLSDLNAMLSELAEITHCRPDCPRPEGLVCVGDDYLWLREESPAKLYAEGRLWLGCENSDASLEAVQ